MANSIRIIKLNLVSECRLWMGTSSVIKENQFIFEYQGKQLLSAHSWLVDKLKKENKLQ